MKKNEYNEVGGIKGRNEWKVDTRTRRKMKDEKEKYTMAKRGVLRKPFSLFLNIYVHEVCRNMFRVLD